MLYMMGQGFVTQPFDWTSAIQAFQFQYNNTIHLVRYLTYTPIYIYFAELLSLIL